MRSIRGRGTDWLTLEARSVCICMRYMVDTCDVNNRGCCWHGSEIAVDSLSSSRQLSHSTCKHLTQLLPPSYVHRPLRFCQTLTYLLTYLNDLLTVWFFWCAVHSNRHARHDFGYFFNLLQLHGCERHLRCVYVATMWTNFGNFFSHVAGDFSSTAFGNAVVALRSLLIIYVFWWFSPIILSSFHLFSQYVVVLFCSQHMHLLVGRGGGRRRCNWDYKAFHSMHQNQARIPSRLYCPPFPFYLLPFPSPSFPSMPT